MTEKLRFRGVIEAASGGGAAVRVPADVAAPLGGLKRMRVVGTIDGTAFRSSTMPYGGSLYLGVHKATREAAAVAIGDEVEVTLARDNSPRSSRCRRSWRRPCRPSRSCRRAGTRWRSRTDASTPNRWPRPSVPRRRLAAWDRRWPTCAGWDERREAGRGPWGPRVPVAAALRPGRRGVWSLLRARRPAGSVPGPGSEPAGSSVEVGGEDPTAANEAALDRFIERLEGPDHEPTGEVVVRLSLTGGWDLPAQEELHLSIEDDGRVVMVTDTSVFSSVEDYTSLQLSPAGVVRVLDSVRPVLGTRREDLDGGAGVSPTDRSAWLEVGTGITLSMDRLGQTEGYDDGQQAARTAFGGVIDGLRDLGWLGADIETAESPWIPETMTVLATPRTTAAASPDRVAWPLAEPIAALASGTEVAPSGEERRVVCLAGADVGPVFALLTGVNHAHLEVDDGAAWELDVRPHYPGYRLYGDPCQG